MHGRGRCAAVGLSRAGAIALLCAALFISLYFCPGALTRNASGSQPAVSSPAAESQPSPALKQAPPVVAQAPRKAPADPPRYYVVRRGDSLSEIAASHQVSLRALKQTNGLRRSDLIYPGQRLRLPAFSARHSGGAAPTSRVDRVLRTALAYRGVRYRYGGMSSRGFDCSGFVTRVLLTQGLRLPHNAAALFKFGKPVAKAGLRPGDLVFFKTVSRRGISHVGIYLGNNQFIHASSGRGSVRTDTLASGYYARRYAGARRIIQPSQTPGRPGATFGCEVINTK